MRVHTFKLGRGLDQDLRINDIGDDGAFAIAEALKVNTSLTSISLTYNKFGYATREELLHAAKPTLQLRL